MSVQVVPVWTPERAEIVLEQSLALVTKLDPVEDLRVPLFQSAVQMLSNVLVQQGSPVAVSLPGLTQRNGKRG